MGCNADYREWRLASKGSNEIGESYEGCWRDQNVTDVDCIRLALLLRFVRGPMRGPCLRRRSKSLLKVIWEEREVYDSAQMLDVDVPNIGYRDSNNTSRLSGWNL
jgi:hypothetical protein